jgi:hypothetical protein
MHRAPVFRRLAGILLAALTVLALVLVGAQPAAARRPGRRLLRAHDRVIAYYQTIYTTAEDGTTTYVDPKPLRRVATDINLGAIHLNDDRSLHVNDVTADDPSLRRVWRDLHRLRRRGVRINVFVGGAAQGSYRNLAEEFDIYYPILRDFLTTYRLDGVDLDIEETYSIDDAVMLITALRRDFGPRFTITLTPVAQDLAGETDFSGGFSYAELERRAGFMINWYNTQFYCGWGDLASTEMYDKVLANGFAPSRIVAGTVTNPVNCRGYVDPPTLRKVLRKLNRRHPGFGGVFGWEYFNALGPNDSGPAGWYRRIKADIHTRRGR